MHDGAVDNNRMGKQNSELTKLKVKRFFFLIVRND